MRRIILLAAAAAIMAGILPSCSSVKDTAGTSDLYLLEELETARSVEDADRRIERLEIFAANNPAHPYRALAFESIFETMAIGKGDVEGALAYYDALMEKESDPAIRGKLIFKRFEFFWETDSLQSVALVKDVLESGENDFRLLMYMAYYLMGAEGQEEIADAVFSQLIEVTGDEHRKNHARTIYAEFLEAGGRGDEAGEVLELASSYTFANEQTGRRLWEEDRREEALERYVYLVAGAPGYRKYIKLDSLYAIVYPSANDLESKIAAFRIVDGPQIPDREFVDIRGMRHSISGYRGLKVVITAFSPTCPPCIAELPQMEELKQKEAALGFKLLLIDEKGMLEKTRGIIDDKGVTIPVLLDSRQYSREVLGTMYTPTTYVIDEEGRVRCRLVGHSEDFNGIIADVLSRI